MKKKNKSLALHIMCVVLCAVLITSIAAFGACAQSADEGEGSEESEASDSTLAENPFESLYLAVREHLGEIMCAVSLALTVLVSLLYKKGLMPFMSRTLGTIGSAIAGIKTSTDEYAKSGGESMDGIKAMLEKAQKTISSLESGLAVIESTLSGMASDKGDIARFKAVMECQSTRLFDILMNSSIPQYQKDAVGEKLTEIKSALSECSCGENTK